MAMIEVSDGELLDKYSILNLKYSKINDVEKRINILAEITTLCDDVEKIFSIHDCGKLDVLYTSLCSINEKLWDIEDDLREMERDQAWEDKDGMEHFIELARSVYFTNDTRSKIKKQINDLTGSRLVEEKSYEKY